MSSAFSFDSEVIERALRNIYSKEFNAMTDIEQNLFSEFWSKLCEATDIGIAKSNTSYITGDFYHELQHNNAVFAAFKTHRMGNDMAKLLRDSNGNLKPFEQWANDVRPIADHQVYYWFKTEYVTAINRATHAANWKQFKSVSHILPNLKWRPSTAANPRELHSQFYGLVLPIGHWFWGEHSPGDAWNCQCRLLATAEQATPDSEIPNSQSVAAKGLDNNPANDGKLFSDSHPYYTNAYKGADKAVDTKLTKVYAAIRKEIKDKAKSLFASKKFYNKDINKPITISNASIGEWLNQGHRDYYLKNEYLLNLERLITDGKYVGKTTDKHNSNITAHFIEVEFGGGKSWIILREFPDGSIRVHGISDGGAMGDMKKIID